MPAFDPTIVTLQAVLSAFGTKLNFAVLVGSRATGSVHATSDWDIALYWKEGIAFEALLAYTETLRRALAQALAVPETSIDLIDLRRANLAMRCAAAEEGVPLWGEDTLSWMHFLRKTWRDLEDYYWDKQHAA